MENSTLPGNFESRQRKMQQERSYKMFPPLSGVAKKLEEKGERNVLDGGKHSPILSSIPSHQSSRTSSHFSGLSGRRTNSSTFHFSSSPPSRSSSPCVPTCRPVPMYVRSSSSRAFRQGSKCIASLPESISEEGEDETERTVEVGGAGVGGGETGESDSKKKKNKKKRKRRNTIASGTVRISVDLRIPKHIMESLKLKEQLPAITPQLARKGLSPMHGMAKHDWLSKLIDPAIRSLQFPSHPKAQAAVNEFPFLQASDIRAAFRRFCDRKTTKGCMTEVPVSKVTAPADKQVGPSLYPCIKPVPSTIAPKPSLSAGELKSLHLNHNDHYCRRMPEHMPGSMFTQCPGDGLWYVIHPDFRMEPGMRGADLGKKGVQPW